MIDSPIGIIACGITIGNSADWLRWSNSQRSRITGHAATTTNTATAMKVSSASSASTFCTGIGIIPTMTSMRSCRPDHATTPLPRNTQATMR